MKFKWSIAIQLNKQPLGHQFSLDFFLTSVCVPGIEPKSTDSVYPGFFFHLVLFKIVCFS